MEIVLMYLDIALCIQDLKTEVLQQEKSSKRRRELISGSIQDFWRKYVQKDICDIRMKVKIYENTYDTCEDSD
jgi:hypothetical protein